MNQKETNKKVDGYITIGEPLVKALDKINLPNQEFINGISQGLIDAIKPITEYNLNIAKIYTDEIMKQERMEDGG